MLTINEIDLTRFSNLDARKTAERVVQVQRNDLHGIPGDTITEYSLNTEQGRANYVKVYLAFAERQERDSINPHSSDSGD